jgi:hypothetical protein
MRWDKIAAPSFVFSRHNNGALSPTYKTEWSFHHVMFCLNATDEHYDMNGTLAILESRYGALFVHVCLTLCLRTCERV